MEPSLKLMHVLKYQPSPILAKLMPKSAKQFEKIMKEAYNIKV
jgi:hypothetical protein